jgi:RNA polymerase sigma-70 factor (ECF subfamily)
VNPSTVNDVGTPFDHEHFTALVRAHGPRLRAYILAMVPSWSDAEDIYQATCVQLWQEIERLESDEKFGAWAAKIAYFQVLSHRKQQTRSKVTFSDAFIDAVGSDGVALVESQSPRAEALARAVAQLEPQQRMIIDLRYTQNKPLAEVAEIMGKSLEATYQMLARVRRLLRDGVERALKSEGHA